MSENKTAPAPAPAKRKPGRPPSKPPAPPLEMKGIVDAPSNNENRLEMAWQDPMVFKQLFTFFKNLKARDIHIRCAPDGMTFFAWDHTKTSRVHAHVAGDQVNWYYCHETFWIGINRESVEKIFASIDKSFYKVTFSCRYEDSSHLTVIFKDAELDKECRWKIVLSNLDPDETLLAMEESLSPASLESAFPVQFCLNAKKFKKTFSDANNYSTTITIEKLGAHPLRFAYSKINTLSYHEVYRSSEKIKLQSNIEPHQTFRCTVKVANVKSLAGSMVTEEVRVMCRQAEDILFRSAIDEKALVVSVLTKLV